jgi:hypothetical protein
VPVKPLDSPRAELGPSIIKKEVAFDGKTVVGKILSTKWAAIQPNYHRRKSAIANPVFRNFAARRTGVRRLKLHHHASNSQSPDQDGWRHE